MSAPESNKWRFEPTINLGHILTFVGFLVTIVVGWNTLDKRVVILEEGRTAQAATDRYQDALTSQQLVAIRETLSDIKTSVSRIDVRTIDASRRASDRK